MENENGQQAAQSVSRTGTKKSSSALAGIVIASVLIGGIAGYLLKASSSYESMRKDSSRKTEGTHRMPDGAMMYGSSMGMAMDGMTDRLKTEEKGDLFDRAFLEEMIVHHKGAVDMAKLVLEKSARPELRKLAEEIIAAQTKEIDDMKGWLGTWFR
ncbi:MAG: DUF305 domain-containing protein [Candidatus Moranbacteria bacterium]|nr:DUF305 domain-containing protein [Candidatus Moranbacteria bacterium]